MNELDWQRAIDAEPSGPVRLAYADWLEEKGFVCQAKAQRLLWKGCFRQEREVWVLYHHKLPRSVQMRLHMVCDRPVATVEHLTSYNCKYRYWMEAHMLDIVYDLAKAGLEGELE